MNSIVGHWPANNLREVLTFLETQHADGVTLHAVSEVLGVTPQNLSTIFHKDDVHLSWVERLANAYGYSLHLVFPTHPTETNDGFICPDAGNLSGLIRYAHYQNRTIYSISHMIDCDYSVISKAFREGDIRLSILQKILKEWGITILWEWKKTR